MIVSRYDAFAYNIPPARLGSFCQTPGPFAKTTALLPRYGWDLVALVLA
jgi:hypothetical protein